MLISTTAIVILLIGLCVMAGVEYWVPILVWGLVIIIPVVLVFFVWKWNDTRINDLEYCNEYKQSLKFSKPVKNYKSVKEAIEDTPRFEDTVLSKPKPYGCK